MQTKNNAFPLLYQAHHERHPEDIDFWVRTAARQAGPVLELGCGTGRVLLPLAAAGLDVFGLDIDRAMLAVLRGRGQAGAMASIFQADLAHYHLGLPFGAILLPCNTYSTLPRPTRRAMLACARRHLRPGGIFAAGLPNPRLLRRLPRSSPEQVEEVFPHPLDGAPVRVSSAWERSEKYFTVTWHYDHLLPGGRVERTSSQARHHLSSPEGFLHEVREAGFEIGEVFGDYRPRPYRPRSPYLIFYALRK